MPQGDKITHLLTTLKIKEFIFLKIRSLLIRMQIKILTIPYLEKLLVLDSLLVDWLVVLKSNSAHDHARFLSMYPKETEYKYK